MMKNLEEAWMGLQSLIWELLWRSEPCLGWLPVSGWPCMAAKTSWLGLSWPQSWSLLCSLCRALGGCTWGWGICSSLHPASARYPALMFPSNRKVMRLPCLGSCLRNSLPKINMFKRKVVSSHPSSKSFLLQYLFGCVIWSKDQHSIIHTINS